MGGAESQSAGASEDRTAVEFADRAAAWLRENKGRAPRDYGAILPRTLPTKAGGGRD